LRLINSDRKERKSKEDQIFANIHHKKSVPQKSNIKGLDPNKNGQFQNDFGLIYRQSHRNGLRELFNFLEIFAFKNFTSGKDYFCRIEILMHFQLWRLLTLEAFSFK